MRKSYLTPLQKVIINITPCSRPMCQHAVCRAHRAWVQWREAQLNPPIEQMRPHEVKEFLTGINL